jgi:hypothetical protein
VRWRRSRRCFLLVRFTCAPSCTPLCKLSPGCHRHAGHAGGGAVWAGLNFGSHAAHALICPTKQHCLADLLLSVKNSKLTLQTSRTGLQGIAMSRRTRASRRCMRTSASSSSTTRLRASTHVSLLVSRVA